MKPFIYFIYNPISGKGSIKTKLNDIVLLLNRYDYEVIVYATTKKNDAYHKLLEVGPLYQNILCSGGDGTLNEIVHAYQELSIKPRIAYLPSGTTNDFANSLKLEKNTTKYLKSLMDHPDPIVYDIGKFNDQYFNYVAAFGSVSEVSYTTPQASKNILGHTAYLIEGLKKLVTLKKYIVHIEYDDGIIEDEICLGMITNSMSVGGYQFFHEHDINLSDGYFECIFIKNPNNPIDIHQTIRALTSKKYEESDRIYAFKTKKLHVSFKKSVKWTLDGEYAGRFKESEIINIHKGMKLIK